MMMRSHSSGGILLAATVVAAVTTIADGVAIYPKLQKSCSVCQDGSEILYPQVHIEELGQTCAELQEEASNYIDPVSCRYYHRYGNSCGCKNIPPKESFCELCQDSSPIPEPDLWLDGYDGNCGSMAVDAQWNLWHTFDKEVQKQNEDNNNMLPTCDYYHHVGSLCGCKNNRPPTEGCNLCVDGNRPSLEEKSVTPGNAGEETCRTYSHLTKYLYQEGTEECQKAQSIVGSYCGCSETPQDAPTCDMCPSGLVMSDTMAPDIQLEEGNRVFYFKDAACIKIAMLASEFDFSCQSVPEEYVDACCLSATSYFGPAVYEQENPTLDEAPDEAPINWDEFIFLSAATTPKDYSFRVGVLAGMMGLLLVI